MASEAEERPTDKDRRPLAGDRLALLREVDRYCDEFEAAWRGGAAPDCEEHLVDSNPEMIELLLREMLLVEWQYRGGADDPTAVRAALAERPPLRRICDAAGIQLDSLLDSLRGDVVPSVRKSKGHGTIPFPPKGEAPPPTDGALRLRCPHCQNGVELLPDAPLDEVTCNSCGSQFGIVGSPDDKTATPLRVGRFVLEERLGVGGFGAVWRARDPELDRLVALKIPRSGQLLPHETELFLREARAAAQLAHANIVPVHEVGRHEESVFIVSDLIEGEPLSDRLKRERPTREEAVELLATIADAADYAHSRGVIHRDLKPSNVMLDGAGTPYVMDFGLAKRETGEITMTLEGQVLGTPAYMSPEQASGQIKWVDRRTDVYALGVMMFQMLTGELPFRGTAQSQLHQRLCDDPPSPRRLDPGTPLDLATVCLKALERDQNRRYGSASEFADELRRWRRGEPVVARPLSRAATALRWSRRHPTLASTLVLGAVLAIAGPTAAVVIYQRGQENTRLLGERNENIARSEAEIDRLNEHLDALEGAGRPRPRAYHGAHASPWKRQLVRTLLESRETAFASAIESLPEGSLESARARMGLAYLYAAAERLDDGVTVLRLAAMTLAPRAAPNDAAPPVVELHAECCEQLAELLAALDRRDESAPLIERASALRSRLAAAAPDSMPALAGAIGGLAQAPPHGEMQAAELLHIEAMRSRFVDAFGRDPTHLYDDALTLLNASHNRRRVTDWEE